MFFLPDQNGFQRKIGTIFKMLVYLVVVWEMFDLQAKIFDLFHSFSNIFEKNGKSLE